MKKVKWFVESIKNLFFRNIVFCSYLIIILVLGIVAVPRIFAEQQAIPSVEIFSEKLNYMNKNPGSWKVTKSAKWISKGTAEITFDVDTVIKTNSKNTDVLFVLDVSGSMSGEKLDKVKEDTIELIELLLSGDKNEAGLIIFDTDSHIISPFTNSKEELIEKVENLSDDGATNYYQALVNVDRVLKDYVKKEDRNCIVLFLTDGSPNVDIPNEEGQYSYLKSQYPFITINGVQYEMGSRVLEPFKKISDNQFIADMETLNNILFEASVSPVMYDNFEITDYIDTNYFYVDSVNDIKANQGNVSFDEDNQKFTWKMSNLKSGSKLKMTISAKLKDELIEEVGYYPTNAKEIIKSTLDGDYNEDITSLKTPVLLSNYKVIYDGNAPSGCSVEGIPETKVKWPYETVSISDNVPKCEGYQFKGWGIVTKNVKRVNDDYFIMPEEDVTVRALWSKVSIDKSVDGKIHTRISSTMEKVIPIEEEVYLGGGCWEIQDVYHSTLRDSGYTFKKIVFQNEYNIMTGATDVLDLSEEKNGGIIAYIFPDDEDSSLYTAYIQGDGKIVLNEDSPHLFDNFYQLESIEGIEYLDTSMVKDMSSMFYNCERLKNLDLSNFDTSTVTDMRGMFEGCSSLINLNLSSFDTSKVIDMSSMFWNCSDLTSLNLSSFNTTNVADMGYMFYDCDNLVSLDLSNFDTSKVTNMRSMFSFCNSLTILNFGSFDTSNVTDMNSMFDECSSLINLNLSSFDTANVTDMGSMFYGCSSLTSLNLSSFNTSNVDIMGEIFRGCSGLTSLDLSNFDTSKIESMKNMFYGCSSLKILDLSGFDTSNVTDMNSMFSGCSGLTGLNLSSFDTSKVTDMVGMFVGCSGFTSLDLSGFDTSNVTYMSNMFSGCSGLTSLNLSSFDTSKVTKMSDMFEGCSGLTSLDLSNFDTVNVTDMAGMFDECSSLASLDLSSFDTSKVIGMSYMFNGCSNLTSLDLSNFDTSNVIYMSFMFRACVNLNTVITVSSKLSQYDRMFVLAATGENAKIVVNYTEAVADSIDMYINTKSYDSNVVKGDMVTV